MPATTERIRRLLGASQLFSNLDAVTLENLARHTSLQSLRRGDALWRQGDAAHRFVVIVRGLVKIVRLMPDGSESILGVFGPRESVGDVAVCGPGIYPASALISSDDAEVLMVRSTPVMDIVARRADVAASINNSVCSHCTALQSKISIMSAGSVSKRLATVLLCLADRFGDIMEDGSAKIPVVISRGELACLIGARVETTIRAIRQLERDGVVASEEDGLVLRDVAHLRAMTEMDDRLPCGSSGQPAA